MNFGNFLSDAERRVNATLGRTPSTQQQADLDDVGQLCTRLSYRQRVACFVALLALGVFCDFLAVSVFLFKPTKFAKLYTIGNMALLGSTLFLVGPARQLQNMFHPSRFIATLLYVLAMLATLYCALALRRVGPTLVAVALQSAALLWYAASYVPFAQACLRRTGAAILV